jgi:ABC-2 type transport system ATP-binding protein
MIRVRELGKSFEKKPVLAGLDLNVEKASVYGLLGPNGAGKTTLIKHLAGIYRADRGTVEVDGEKVYDNPVSLGKLFYIPDDPCFFNGYDIEEMARFYAKIYSSWNWERFRLLKEAFPFGTGRKIAKLSKGMQKQVAFWLGISCMPRVMLMDEPMDGLDPVMRRQVWNLLLQDVAEREMTVLVSSHNLRELEEVCDSVGILHDGKILLEKNLDDLKENIHKLQVAFPPEVADDATHEVFQDFEVLSRTEKGSVHQFIVRGERERVLDEIRRRKPAVLDVLPLTLEEIFIYELGGTGYEVKNILI